MPPNLGYFCSEIVLQSPPIEVGTLPSQFHKSVGLGIEEGEGREGLA